MGIGSVGYFVHSDWFAVDVRIACISIQLDSFWPRIASQIINKVHRHYYAAATHFIPITQIILLCHTSVSSNSSFQWEKLHTTRKSVYHVLCVLYMSGCTVPLFHTCSDLRSQGRPLFIRRRIFASITSSTHTQSLVARECSREQTLTAEVNDGSVSVLKSCAAQTFVCKGQLYSMSI